MDRRDYYYRQKVLEAELDAGFAGAETAERALAVDYDYVARTPPAEKENFGGIMWGLEASFGGGLDVLIEPGAAYGELGIRVGLPTGVNVTLSNEGDTQIGQGATGDGAAIALASNQECWVTIFLRFDRLLSDQRYDGYNNLVYHQRDESMYFTIEKGVTRTIGALTAGDKPARKQYHTLLADVHMKNTGGGIFINTLDVDPDTKRVEYYFDYVASNLIHGNPPQRIRSKYNIRDVAVAQLEMYNDHIAGLEDQHLAVDIQWTATQAWADGTSVASTDVLNAINEVISDLAVKQPAGVASSGAKKIGTRAMVGGAAHEDATNPYSMAQTDIQTILDQLTEQINARVFRGADLGIGGPLGPSVHGGELGDSGGNKWDAFLRDLYVTRYLKTGLIPEVADDNALDMGTAAARMRNIFAGNLLQNDGLTDLNGNLDVAGESTFHDKVTVDAPNGDHGLVATFNGAAADGKNLVQINKWYAALSDFLTLSKTGAPCLPTGHYEDMNKYTSWNIPSTVVTDHLPEESYSGGGDAAGAYSYEMNNFYPGEGRSFQMSGPASTVGHVHGPGLYGLDSNTVMFECSFVVSSATLNSFETAYIGLEDYGFSQIVAFKLRKATDAGFFGYIKAANPATEVVGTVNLLPGNHAADTLYTLRFIVLSDTQVYFEGPGGSEVVVHSPGFRANTEAAPMFKLAKGSPASGASIRISRWVAFNNQHLGLST